MRGKVTIVGCPKLDPVDYSENVASSNLSAVALA